MVKAKINDVFVSIQGEGKYLGQEQCFVRFFGCDLGCDYCDTKLDSFKEYSVDELLQVIKDAVGSKDIRSISLTGGEPLLHRDFLLELLPKLKQAGFENYLETNGVMFNEVFDVLDYIDIIAMDIKLPSSTKAGEKWQEHQKFLEAAKDKEIFVKVIVCKDSKIDDIKIAAEMVSKVNSGITFVLQPNSGQLGRELADKLQEFKQCSKQYLKDVRIIPQLHKMMGIK